MSKGTIGGVIGGIIGFVATGFNPAGFQAGFVIGSAIGSSFDTIQGRQVGELSTPTAQEGEPIPLVFGTARVRGRLMLAGTPVIREEGGKGGPQVVNESAYLSYSILICESSELRNSLVRGILMVFENNKLVYDVSANPQLSSVDNAKWLANKKFYYGEESQGVDATEQMICGVDNTPAYRGICRMVVTEENVTETSGGSIPIYEFVVSACPVAPPNYLLITGTNILEGGPMYAAATATDDPEFVGIEQSTGADLYGKPVFFKGTWGVAGPQGVRYSVDNRETFQTGAHPWDSSYDLGDFFAGVTGWGVTNMNLSHFDDLQYGGPIAEMVDTTYGFVDHEHYAGGFYWRSWGGLLYRKTNLLDTYEVHSDGQQEPGNDVKIYVWADIKAIGVSLYATVRDLDGNYKLVVSSDGGVTWATALVTRASGEGQAPYFICPAGEDVVVYCFGGGVWTSANDWAEWIDTGLEGAVGPIWLPGGGASFYIDGGRRIAWAPGASDDDPGYLYVIGAGSDSNKCAVSLDSGLTFPLVKTLPITGAVGIAASTEFEPTGGGVIIPDAPGHEIDPVTGEVTGPGNSVANACGITLQEIVDRLDVRAGIPEANRDSDALADIIVPGYAIDQFMTVADAKEPLRQVFRFDCPEYDDAIRYTLRGRATDFVVDPDDLILTDDATEKSLRGQTVEFPRRLHVKYVDANTGYKPMKQTAERISPDIRVKGELVTGANMTLEADTAKQAADIGLKVAWTEREDSREIALPMDYFARAIASHTYTLEGRRFRITKMRFEAWAIYIESIYDRVSAYESHAVGTVGPSPTAPSSSVRGPTLSAIMNAPVLRDEDDKAGVYWAACGPMSGWRGAKLQLSRNGGATWEDGPSVDSPAVMGELTAPLPAADRYAQDNTNTLTVTLYRSETLESVELDDLLSERNAFAILYPGNKVEIGQFQNAAEIADRQWELTGLLRGRMDTEPGEHLAGAIFVLLDDGVRFVPIRADDIGKTLKFRAISNGTDPDAAEVQDVTFATIESLREWQPYNLETVSDGSGGYCFSWIGRARLGSEAYPVHSQFFDGYSLRLTDGVVIHDIDTDEQSVCVSADEMEDIFGSGYGEPMASVVAKSTSSQNDYNAAAPVGWVAVSGTWTEDPAGYYNLLPDGASQGRMYYDTLYAFTSGTFEASVDVFGPILSGLAGLTVDFVDAAGVTFLTEQGSTTLTMTAAELVPFGTVAFARVHLRAVSSSGPFPSPVIFSNLSVSVTP